MIDLVDFLAISVWKFTASFGTNVVDGTKVVDGLKDNVKPNPLTNYPSLLLN